MKRFHARVKVVEMLKDKGLYVEEKDNAMAVPICSYVLILWRACLNGIIILQS